MLLIDSAIYFEIPARDALGREAVSGKLRGTQDKVFFHWRLKDRTFRKMDGDMKTVEMTYLDVESVTYKATLGFLNPRLVFQVADPHLLEGARSGCWEGDSHAGKAQQAGREKFIKLVEFKKVEAEAARFDARLRSGETLRLLRRLTFPASAAAPLPQTIWRRTQSPRDGGKTRYRGTQRPRSGRHCNPTNHPTPMKPTKPLLILTACSAGLLVSCKKEEAKPAAPAAPAASSTPGGSRRLR